MKTTLLQDKRFWLGAGGLVAALIVAISWFMLIHPKRADSDSLRSQAADVDVQNSALQAKTAQLARENRHMSGLQSKLKAAMAALPPSSELPEFTRAVTASATRSGVDLTSITIGSEQGVIGATPSTAAPSAAAPSSNAPADGSGASSAPAAAPATSAAASQFSITVTVTCKGTAGQDTKFLYTLQHGARSVLVTSSQLAAGQTGDKVTMTTQLQIFTAPLSRDALAQVQHLLSAKD